VAAKAIPAAATMAFFLVIFLCALRMDNDLLELCPHYRYEQQRVAVQAVSVTAF
jgi:hypothetical protein